jgi:catecholate siderophore receptor
MNKYKLTYLVLAAASSAVYANLQAQENDIVELDDYEVVGKYLQADQITSLKTPTPIEDIPKSVSILTSDLIGLQDLTSMAGIADYVPGIVAGQGEGHRDDILFRGQKSTADFFVDGVRDDIQYYRPLYNVEQVEVLKGADALFFGRGGTGGLINRVSKTAQIGEDFTGYSLSFDDFGERSLQIDSNMTIAPNAALRINYYTEDLENDREHFYGDNSGINPTLNFELSEKTTVNVSYENLDQERFIDRGITANSNGNPDQTYIGTTFGDADYNKSTLSADMVKVSVDHKIDDSTKLRLNYTDNEFSKMYQNYYAKSSVTGAVPTVTAEGYHDETERSNTILSADIIGEKKFVGKNHKYVIGYESIETSNDNMRKKGDGTNTSVSVELANLDNLETLLPQTEDYDNTKATVDVTSLYFSDEIELTEEFNLVLGGRLDEFDITVVDSLNGGTLSQVSEEFSTRVGLVYNPEDNVSWYASYSETFLPKSGDQYASLDSAEQGLDSNVFENLEFGVKFTTDNGIDVTATVYELTSIQPEYNGPLQTKVEEIEAEGLELQAAGNVSDNWFMSAGFSKVNNADALKEVPGKTFSLWNLYKYNEKLSFGLGIINKGATKGKYKTNPVYLPSYTRIDLAAYYKIDDNMRLQLNVENVTDEVYFPHSYGDHQISVGAPMHATIKLVGRF